MRQSSLSPIRVQVSPFSQSQLPIFQTEPAPDLSLPNSPKVPQEKGYLIQSLIQRIVHIETSLKGLRKENELIKQNQKLIFENHTNENGSQLILHLKQQQDLMQTEMQNFMRLCTANLQNFQNGLSEVMRLVMQQPSTRKDNNMELLKKLQSGLTSTKEDKNKSKRVETDTNSEMLLTDMLNLRARIDGAIDTVTRRGSQMSATQNNQKCGKQSSLSEENESFNPCTKLNFERSYSDKNHLASKIEQFQQEKTMTARILANILQNKTSYTQGQSKSDDKEPDSYSRLHQKIKGESPSHSGAGSKNHVRNNTEIIYASSNKSINKNIIQNGKIERRNKGM